MAILKKRPNVAPRRPLVDRDIDSEWWREFVGYFPDGAAWNNANNHWVNEQYALGMTPKQTFDRCAPIGMGA